MVDWAEAFTASVEGVVLERKTFLSGIIKQCLSFGALICCLGYDLAGHFHRAGHTDSYGTKVAGKQFPKGEDLGFFSFKNLRGGLKTCTLCNFGQSSLAIC